MLYDGNLPFDFPGREGGGVNLGILTEPARYVVPKDCRQCVGPCIDVCPTAAVLRQLNKHVVIAPMKCNGCQLCIVACPLGILEFDPGNKIARMLDLRFNKEAL